jgi:hypothetical protein
MVLSVLARELVSEQNKIMKINLNRRVRVKLNRHGQNILINFYSRVIGGYIQGGEKYCDSVYPGWRDGSIQTQCWELFEVFGPKLMHGGAIPFELNEFELLPDDPTPIQRETENAEVLK